MMINYKDNTMNKFAIKEQVWFAEQKKQVEDYLQAERIEHLGVNEAPAFYVYPYIALWSVQSKVAPGYIGWWAISGDVPTDYISSDNCKSPREALRCISIRWLEGADHMLRGESPPGFNIGTPEQWPLLGELLRKRAMVIQEFAEDESLWQ